MKAQNVRVDMLRDHFAIHNVTGMIKVITLLLVLRALQACVDVL